MPSLPPMAAELGYTDPTESAAYTERAMRGLQVGSMVAQSLITQEIIRESRHDALTGVLNRDGFEKAIADLSPEDLARSGVLFMDATNFKAVNDRLGHDKGDQLLQAIGAALNKTRRQGDYAARIGGDEFMLLITHQSETIEYAPNRRRQATIPEQVAGARARFEEEIEAILDEQPEAVAHGFGVAIGATLGSVGRTIDDLKAAAEAEMMLHKATQHQRLGQYRKS